MAYTGIPFSSRLHNPNLNLINFPKSITQKNAKGLEETREPMKNAKTSRTINFTDGEGYLHREDERVEDEEEPEERSLGIEENCAGFLSVSPSGNRVCERISISCCYQIRSVNNI